MANPVSYGIAVTNRYSAFLDNGANAAQALNNVKNKIIAVQQPANQASSKAASKTGVKQVSQVKITQKPKHPSDEQTNLTSKLDAQPDKHETEAKHRSLQSNGAKSRQTNRRTNLKSGAPENNMQTIRKNGSDSNRQCFDQDLNRQRPVNAMARNSKQSSDAQTNSAFNPKPQSARQAIDRPKQSAQLNEGRSRQVNFRTNSKLNGIADNSKQIVRKDTNDLNPQNLNQDQHNDTSTSVFAPKASFDNDKYQRRQGTKSDSDKSNRKNFSDGRPQRGPRFRRNRQSDETSKRIYSDGKEPIVQKPLPNFSDKSDFPSLVS